MIATIEFIKDHRIKTALLDLFEESKQNEELTIVSPYVGLWGHARDYITSAVRRGVRLRFYYRKPEHDRDQLKKADKEFFESLKGAGDACVFEVPRLHAKIYLAGDVGIVTSMNLCDSSADASREIGYHVRDPAMLAELRQYISTLGATPVYQSKGARIAKMHAPLPAPAKRIPSGRVKQAEEGVCIRCGEPKPYDPKKPLCSECYKVWANFKNPDYPEAFCHRCGSDKEETSLSYPLCRSCYRQTRNSKSA